MISRVGWNKSSRSVGGAPLVHFFLLPVWVSDSVVTQQRGLHSNVMAGRDGLGLPACLSFNVVVSTRRCARCGLITYWGEKTCNKQ